MRDKKVTTKGDPVHVRAKTPSVLLKTAVLVYTVDVPVSAGSSSGSGRSSVESGELVASRERSRVSSDMEVCSNSSVEVIKISMRDGWVLGWEVIVQGVNYVSYCWYELCMD